MSERSITDRVMGYVKMLPCANVEKRHGSAYSVSGAADLTGCVGGVRFEIEMKDKGKRPTRLQVLHLELWAAAGAVVGWADNYEAARAIVDYAGNVACNAVAGGRPQRFFWNNGRHAQFKGGGRL